MNYLFLTIFWLGIALIYIKPQSVLRERIDSIWEIVKSESKKSFVYVLYQKAKAKRKKDILTKELSDCLSYIKNVVILGHDTSISANTVLEELSDFSNKLRQVFVTMSHYININDKARARDCLFEAIGTSVSRDIGVFLAGWDDIPPSDIIDSIELFQNILKEERLTREKRRDELISDLVYFPVVINCMLVLLNFIFVAYFIEQKDALMVLF